MDSVLMRIPLQDGSDQFIEAEVDPLGLEDVELVADDGQGRRFVQAAGTLAAAFDHIEPALSMLVTRLRDAARAPEEITLGFGLKLGGETGLVFAKGKSEASFTVSVTWARNPASARERAAARPPAEEAAEAEEAPDQ
ncbi:CU044_2847 family protein [Actinomadura meyerae]|jgi:hypothetical protein|nr:CU044_2847 family protein [Actinomadura meyerae]